VVIGSQAVLGQVPQAPQALLASIEADLYPRYAPERSDLIDGTIGELPVLHERPGHLPLAPDRVAALRDRLHRVAARE
jgi:hypothetical protein